MVILHPLLSPPCSRLENPGRIRDYDVQVNDSGKGVKGHKRSILVHTLALLMAVVITSAQHTALQVARKIQRTDTFKQRYACVRALKRPSRQECVPLICGVLGKWEYQRRICSTLALQQRSIWSALSCGSMAIRLLLPGFRPLKGFSM